MAETRLIILKITTADTYASKTIKHLDDAIDIMKAKYNADIIQYEIPQRTFTSMIKNRKTIEQRQV